MRRFAFLFAFGVLVLPAGPAPAQDFRTIAQLPRAGPPGALFFRPLAAGGPPFVISVGRNVVNAWPAGRVAEPVVSPIPTAYVNPPSAAFGDFDGDGFTDLAVVVTNAIAVFKGDGTGRFVPAATIAPGTQPLAVAAGDVDGDGRSDLVFVPANQGTPVLLTCLLSAGHFAFAAGKTSIVATDGGIDSLTAGDVDGDGRADVVTSAAQGPVTLFKSAGDGTFTRLQDLLGWFPGPVTLVDLDRDGRPDLVYENPDSEEYMVPVEIYRNDGGGTFHLWAEPQKTRSATGPVVGDFDGDGLPDVSFVDLDQATGASYLDWVKFSGGTPAEGRIPTPYPVLGTIAGDWDGDGKAELLVPDFEGVWVLGRAGSRTDVSVVPVLLSTSGLYGTRFESDLLLTNSGTTSAHLTLRYVASQGGGSGVLERDLPAGRQLYAPAAAAYLRDAGLPITAEGNVVGTLRIEATGASAPRVVSVCVRTTTPAGAGVSYVSSPLVGLLREDAILPWLIETGRDRTNLAVANAGGDADGPVTLRVEVHAGDLSAPPVVLPDLVVAPGEMRQIGRVLVAAGLAAPVGWARITRVGGSAPYLAWAAVNDAGTGDGSFVPAVPESRSVSWSYPPRWVVPSAVQTARYKTEFVASNPGTQPLDLQVVLVTTWTFLTETIAPGATFYVPDLFAELRRRGLPGAPAADVDTVSALYVSSTSGPAAAFAGVRVTSSPEAGKSYGVFEAAMPADALGGISAVVPDLRQDASVRTNLGLLNLSEGPQSFHLEIVDGETGSVAGAADVTLGAGELRQVNAVLTSLASGTRRAFARVTPLTAPWNQGPKPFAAYSVINDGATPGAGTDDGSFVPAIPD